MNIVSAVSNLQKELDYYKKSYQEQQEIIKQLSEGPGEIEYIHPHDLAVIMDAVLKEVPDKVIGTILEIDGKKYKQSPLIPAKTKDIS